MTWRMCRREPDVRAASANGRWTPVLEGHVAVCDRCREVRTVTRALAAPMDSVPVLVDPALLWARARATAHVRALARLDRILTISQLAFGVAALGALALTARVVGIPLDAGGPDVNTLVIAGGVMLTVATALVVRWAKP
jgi:hypothetical protein